MKGLEGKKDGMGGTSKGMRREEGRNEYCRGKAGEGEKYKMWSRGAGTR
jgi:hypothetical protein